MLSLLVLLAVIGGAWCMWRVVRWVWLRPRAIERCLRKQGLKGPPYRLLHGDMKQLATMARQAATNAKPISFSDDFLPTILPFYHHNIKTYGNFVFYVFLFYFILLTLVARVLNIKCLAYLAKRKKTR